VRPRRTGSMPAIRASCMVCSPHALKVGSAALFRIALHGGQRHRYDGDVGLLDDGTRRGRARLEQHVHSE
jgi:hypothetical protein